MNISRFLVGALVLCALPAFAQPDEKPDAKPSFPMVSPEDAGKLGLTEKPMAFHLRDTTLRDALGELQKQSGVPLDLRWNGGTALDKKLSLDLETRSFNEAFSAMLDEADVKARLQRWSGNVAWHLEYGERPNESDAPQSGVGLFQLRATSLNFTLNRTMTLGKIKKGTPSAGESLSATFTFPSDPQLPVVRTPRVRVTRAEDEAGHSVRKDDADRNFYGGGIQDRADVALLVPAKTSHKIAHLDGVVTYVLASRNEHWEVPDVLNAKNPTHTFSSNGQQVMASVLSVEQKRGAIEVEFQLTEQGAPNLNDGQSLEDRNPIFSFERLASSLSVRDSKGVMRVAEGTSGSGDGNGYTIQLRFPPPVPDTAPTLTGPLTFVFDAPSEFVQTEVPFSFENLPLP